MHLDAICRGAMHGLINKSVQCFAIDTYGVEVWRNVAKSADIGVEGFEPLRKYREEITEAIISSLSEELGQSPHELFENLGLYLVNHENCQSVRRLLRFGGDTFYEFLHSLPELNERAAMAVDGLLLPRIFLHQHIAGEISLTVGGGMKGAASVLAGIVRAMADDYGALAMIDYVGRYGSAETISVVLFEHDFTEGNSFVLASGAAA